VAAHLEPEILLVDEVLAVGDVAFQKKCLGKIG
jgi:lipopolysaccharide transport system ATP-binding protein